MNLFGKLGDALDGVLGKVITTAVKTAVKVYETKTPAISVESLIDAGTEKAKVAVAVGAKLISNGRAKLKAIKKEVKSDTNDNQHERSPKPPTYVS